MHTRSLIQLPSDTVPNYDQSHCVIYSWLYTTSPSLHNYIVHVIIIMITPSYIIIHILFVTIITNRGARVSIMSLFVSCQLHAKLWSIMAKRASTYLYLGETTHYTQWHST